MAEALNSNKTSIKFTPWSDKGYGIVKLHLWEALGGEIARGDAELWHDGSDDALELVTDEREGEITLKDTQDGGLEYKIPIYITSRSFLKNTLNISFVCIKDKSFLTKQDNIDYDDITSALKALYPGEVDIRIDSDTSNDVKIWQLGDTNYDFCTRLAWSYKKDCVFGYGLDRFLLKDLCGEKDSQGNTEPVIMITDALFKRISPYGLNYQKRLNYEPHDSWEEDYSDSDKVNPSIHINYDSIVICDTRYDAMMTNYLWNTSRFRAEYYSKEIIKGTAMPSYRLGDVIKYGSHDQSAKYPWEVYLVAQNEIFIAGVPGKKDSSGLTFSWTSTLYGLDKGKWNGEDEE